MAGDARRQTLERLGYDHRHATGTTAIAVGVALLAGVYASWLAADFGWRLGGFVVASLAAGYWLYGRPTRRGVVVGGLGLFAVLLALTPVVFWLAFLVDAGRFGVGNPWPFVLSLADLVLAAIFLLLAAVPGGLAAWLARRG